ncbi:DMP19 family protein [Algoriphagus yeomjeoni]|uniref:DMP19 family protein n=1 Tax=Algoriphagus yeomjeoni TaxID=291403 RepID=UPI003CE5C92F
MKIGLIISIGVFLLIIGFFIWKRKSKNTQNAPTEFLKLESENQSNKHIPKLPENWIAEIEKKWDGKAWNKYKNAYYDIWAKACEDVYDKNKYWEKNQTHADFLKEVTKEQRVYFTLINFESQVNNGGVYQFLFNYPELSILALQAMQETGLEKLEKDYEIVLKEFFGNFKTIQDLHSKFNDNHRDWNNRWTSFSEGYKELTSTEVIESYFFTEIFTKDYQQKLIDYVKSNPDKIYKIE